MANDLKWMSGGGLILDGNGDLAITTGMETVISMVRTRLKAAIDGWKLYRIGAGLDDFPGNTSNTETEIAIRRRVMQSISDGYIPTNVFTVTTLRLGDEIQVLVYLKDQVVAQATVNANQNVVG